MVNAVRLSHTSMRNITYDSQTELYSLTLVEPATSQHNALILQFPIDQKLLKILADRFFCDLALYSDTGRLMASSNDQYKIESFLSEKTINQIANGINLSTSHLEGFGYHSMLSPLPLGSNGVLYLSASRSLKDMNNLLFTNSWRLLLTVVLTLIIGATFYYRLLLRSLTPLKNLLHTIHQVAKGNLSNRTLIAPGSHLYELGTSFNQMLGQLEILYANRLEAEKSEALNQETLKYNMNLKKKSYEIERANILLKEQYEELSALFQVSRSLTSALDQNLLFDKIFTIFREALHCDSIVLLLYQPGSESLEVVKTTGLETKTTKGLSFILGEGISGMVAASMRPIYSPDLSVDQRNLNYKGRWVSTGSLLSMPMVLQNRLIGVLNIHHQQIKAFNAMAQQMAQAIADQAAISIENSRLYEKTRALSATDDLTGLANRRQFQDYLQREWAQSRRYHSTFSLLMIDIDHFKTYNDIHGHLKGDIALKKVAALLLQNTRGIDLVARFGGEEFVVLLPKASKEGGLAVAQKLCTCIEEGNFIGMEESQPQQKLTVSIGLATFPSDSTDLYELLNLADKALFQAKNSGRNQVTVWSQARVQEKSEMVQAL
ncbi:diguanylate cyclase [Geopsychrobacter electrodiphilus]|uniref:diguanylate cyclase n=1 Tax=Geopsychrobacter electrodiphilus TaxID=225196 RepID=UPI00146D0DDE|nr:diguanylate cyclase [Geopsychrobacter electrodiphilus]